LELFGHNFGPRNAGKLTAGSKDWYYSLESNEILSHKIGLLDQTMTASKKTHNLPQLWCHQPKTLEPKLKNLFYSELQGFPSFQRVWTARTAL